MSDGPSKLEALSKEYWDALLTDNPVFATALGFRSHDDRLPDITPEARVAREAKYASILVKCREIGVEDLSGPEQLTHAALSAESRGQVDYSSCGLEEWTVDPLQGPQVELMNLESLQPVRTFPEAQAMVKRWKAIGPYLDDHVANLARGVATGKIAVREAVEKVVDEIQGVLSKPDAEWTLMRPLAVEHKDWKEEERMEFKNGVDDAVRASVRPALARYLGFLQTEVLPKSRSQDRPGIGHLPGGSEAYARLIRFHTSLGLTPEEIHQTGMKEVERINQEMVILGQKVLGTSDRKEVLKRLRTDPTLYFTNRDEVEAKAESALARAKAAIEKWFGRLPKASCEVVRMGEHEEKHSTIAYYRQPATDGSRPGQYYINTYAPETRPRYEAEVLAYHESIPGHHLQIAIAQELQGKPEFRRNSGVTAFIEGWALYTERLSDEMELYSSDLDHIGVLSYDSWRACRLVVDTGMHAMGWTRAQAINFMLENSALAENNIVNEVDRYITWPGQALAYKAGQLDIIRLRGETERRMGGRFDIKKFHDVVLGEGAVPLEALRQMVGRELA